MRVSRFINSRRLFVLLAAVILVIIAAGLTLRERGRTTSLPVRVVMDVQNTVSAWLYRPVSWAAGVISGIHNLHEMYAENAQLKSELQNYAALKAQLQLAEAQNAQLSKMLGFKNGAGKKWQLCPAHVVGRDPSTWNSAITIDAGTQAGVHENMPVISADGALVGKVVEASTMSAKVALITDTQLGEGVSAWVLTGQPELPFGIVVGSTRTSEGLDLEFLSPMADIKPGQTVVTSGYSDIFPKGILIGTIESVTPGVQGLTKNAAVRPAADLDYLQNVFVITSRGSQP